MRKTIAIILTCLLVFSFSIVVMADTPSDYETGDQPDEYVPEEGEGETPTPTPEPTPTPSSTPTPTPSPAPPSVTFTDVSTGTYYFTPVSWAVAQGITSGTGNNCFSPETSCTRGQIVTFLWNAAKKPEPKGTDNPFKDVKSSDYFYKAVLWAMENNITSGTDSDSFSPGKSCTRDQAVTFLWRAQGKPDVLSSDAFVDVKQGSFYENAVNWAVSTGVTSGVGENRFNPGGICTRGQIVTFLYRAAK